MAPIVWRWLAASSLLIAALAAQAETRPQYGGTLRITMHTAPTSLGPAGEAQSDSFAQRSLTFLLFDTLVTNDGHIHPALATSWQASSNNSRWQLRLRHGVKFHDGTPLTAESAAASLRIANPGWNIAVDGDSIVIEREGPDPELLSELALPRNAIAKRNPDRPAGTGPFQVVDWQPGKKLTLAADEDYWRGRPFLDGMEIEMGRNFRDQWTALELGRADLVEVPPEQTHRISLGGRQLLNSASMELVALIFTREAQTPDEKLLREALAFSIDRASMRSVLLQGAGQASGSILPNSMSGYGFVFPADADLARARHARDQVRTAPSWMLGYDNSDPMARLLAERIALNAKDAGLSLQPTASATADLRLVRIPLASPDPWLSLTEVAVSLQLPTQKIQSASLQELYTSEQKLLATQRIIPLFHLPASYAASATVRDWSVSADGSLHLTDAWLESGKP